MNVVADPTASLEETRVAFREWMADHHDALEPFRIDPLGMLADALAAQRPLQQMLFDAGWTRLGWPTQFGGLDGSPVQRASVLEELEAAGYVIPEFIGVVEIVAPMLARYSPALAALHIPIALRGDEVWCQGFSEPDAGSDLGSLRTKAVRDGEGFRLTGQKMWSSQGTLANRCCVLARTGGAGYKGLTMFWVDLDSPGVTMHPTLCESGRDEVAELFFDDVFVPADRRVGEVGRGWSVVMYLMQFERGAYAWKRQAEMHTQMQELVHHTPSDVLERHADVLGEWYLSLFMLRSQAALTLAKLASGQELGPEISVDKLLLSTSEQTSTDAARTVLYPALELANTDQAQLWRRRWSYARITSIYGGAAEVQHDLVAERLLGLPRGR